MMITVETPMMKDSQKDEGQKKMNFHLHLPLKVPFD
jgi:hypothetical protein